MLLNWTGTCTSTDKVSFTLSYSLYLYQCDSSIHILEAVFPSAMFEAFMFCWYAIGKSNQLHIFKSSDFRLGLSCIMFKKLGYFKSWFRLLRKGNFVAEGNSVVERKVSCIVAKNITMYRCIVAGLVAHVYSTCTLEMFIQ